MFDLKVVKVYFRFDEEYVSDPSWVEPRIVIPRTGDDVLLKNQNDNPITIRWYTVQSLKWITDTDVFVYLTNKRNNI